MFDLVFFLSKEEKRKSKSQVKMIVSFIYYHYPVEKVKSLPFIFFLNTQSVLFPCDLSEWFSIFFSVFS